MNNYELPHQQFVGERKQARWLAWLEKQESVEEIVERCKTSWYNEGKIQGQKEGLSDEEKYQQGWHDALEKQGKLVEEYEDRLDRCACESFNKGYKAAIEHQKEKQGEQKETLCDKCKKAQPSHSCQDITALGRCYIEGMNTSNKVEPKFHEGDTIVEKDFYECGHGTIKDIKNGQYIFTDGSCINIDEQDGWQFVKTSTNVEQRPADKVEPKFKVGDWVVYKNDICQIVKREEGCNKLVTKFGIEKELVNERNLSTARLWTIQDARDGDVLAGSKEDVILIFRGIGNTEWDDVIDYHCCYDCYRKDFLIQKGVEFWGTIKNNQLKPATKEQRDLLFTKMHEAGYEWDAEKRELSGIDTYCKENCKGFQETGKCYCDGGCDAKIDAEKKELKKIENKNPLLSDFFKAEYERGKSDALKCVEWSEEDIEMLNSAISFVEHSAFTTIGKGKNNVISWLKSLKDRIRPQQEWSEEDDDDAWLNDIISKAECNLQLNTDEINWLKSLKDKVQPQPQQDWGEEDEKCLSTIIAEFSKCAGKSVSKDEWMRCNDFLHCIRDRVKSKQEWSHEDDVMVHDILGCLPTKTKPEYNKRREDWIKSLKDRVQPQQEWSEEDEKMLQNILECLRHGWKKLPTDILKYENWLKSLRPQNKWISVDEEIYVKEPVLAQRKNIKEGDVFKGYVICADHTLTPDVYKCYSPINTIMYENRWKPSDEQVKALANACDGKVLLLDYLNSLYEDLKKLKN